MEVAVLHAGVHERAGLCRLFPGLPDRFAVRIMNLLVQNLLVFVAVAASVFFISRSAYRALHGRKSNLNGCGVCTGCATTPQTKAPTSKLAMVSMDALRRSQKSRGSAPKNSSSQS